MSTGADWRTYLASVPTWALEHEAIRRAEVNDRATITLPGLVVNPTGNSVTWRGDTYVVGGRSMQLIYALALARRRGDRWLRRMRLGQLVWRGVSAADAGACASVYVGYVNKRLPGLIERQQAGPYTAYGLVLDDEPATQADVA